MALPMLRWPALIVLMALSLAEVRAEEELPVFADGQARVSFAESARGGEFYGPLLKFAIEDFRRCFQLMTGVELPTTPQKGTVPIVFRLTGPEDGNVNAEQAAAVHDYKIVVEPTQIVIESVSYMGITNGLYGLLDKWGCRWVMPGEIGEVVPKVTSLSLPLGTIDGTMSSDMRVKTYHGGEAGKAWVLRNRNKFGRYLPTDHNWTGHGPGAVVPTAIYNDPAKPDTYHPEYYALIGGKRTPSQICTTNPEVIALAAKAADKFFEHAPLADTFPLEPNDNVDFCQCEKCVALDPPGHTFDGLPLLTDRVVTFANEVAKLVREKHPGKKVGIFAYINHTLPPVNVKPDPDLVVSVCRFNYDHHRLIPREEGDSASQFYQLVKDWKKLVPNVFVYEYNPTYWNANLLSPNYLDFAQTIKDLKEIGSIGSYPDGMIYYDNATNFLIYYMLFRFSVDASLDPTKELAAMCDAFYGPAAKPMLAYYQTMAETTNHKLEDGGLFGGGFRYYYKIFNPDMIERARQSLDVALKEAPAGSVYHRRVELAALNQSYLVAYLDGVWKAQAGDYRGSVEAFDRMDKIVPKLGEAGLLADDKVNVAGVEYTAQRIKGLRMLVLCDYFPEKFGMITRWRMLGPFDNSTRDAEFRKDSFEPLKSIDKPVRLASGQMMDWKDLNSPSGFIDFKKLFGPLDPKWTASYVYVGVKVRAPEKQAVELRMDSFNSFRVFLNGAEVFYRPGWENDMPDGNKVPVTLEAGENTIVVKCTHTADSYTFPWGLFFRITKPDGSRVSGLEFVP